MEASASAPAESHVATASLSGKSIPADDAGVAPASQSTDKSKDTALSLKDAGNAAFARGAFGDAIDAYTAALKLDERSHVLLSNRAAAYLGRGGPGDAFMALADANAAIRFNPSFAKAYGRKVSALLALRQFDDAIATARNGLKLEPGNVSLRDGLVAAQEALASQMARIEAQMTAAAEKAAAVAAAAGGSGDSVPLPAQLNSAVPDSSTAGAGRSAASGVEPSPGSGAAAAASASASAAAVVEADPLASFFSEIQALETTAPALGKRPRPRDEAGDAGGPSTGSSGGAAAAASSSDGVAAPGSSSSSSASLAAETAAALDAEEADTYDARERAAAAAAAAAHGEDGGAGGGPSAEDDVLAAAEAAEGGPAESAAARAAREALSARIAAQELGTGKEQVERLLGPRAQWLNLNPYEVLSLPAEASMADIRARHKRLAALVHPDKNLWDVERARAAFEEVRKAAEALADHTKRRQVLGTVAHAYAAARRAWRKQGQSQGHGVGSASALGGAGAGAGGAGHGHLSLEELRIRECRKAFAEAAQRKVGHEARVKAEARREAERELAAQEAEAAERAAEAAWAEGSSARMEGWSSFADAAAKRRRIGDGGLHLNEVARFGAGRFADVLGAGATGDVTQGSGAGVAGATGAAGDDEAPAGGAGKPSAGAARSGRFATGPTQKPGSAAIPDGDEYRRRWR